MARPKRPVIRLRSQAVWDRLARLKRPQNWLADQMGISRSHLSMLLGHRRAASGPVCARMQRVLNVEDFDELFFLEYPGIDARE